MKKGLKRLAGIALAGALTIGTAAGFSACSSSSHMDKDGNITLSFWSIYPEGDANYQWTKDIISRFETENPTIKINYTGISFWDYFTKITTAMTDSSGPDIYLQTIKDTNDRASGGVSMDITPYLDDEINKSCFYPQDLSTMEYEGGLYGLPYALDNRVLYYNIDIMNTLKTTTDADWQATKAAKKADATISGKPSDLLDADGNELEGEDVFELLKDLQGAFDDGKFPVFEAADGRVVIPVTGMGLWGPVWGYIALEKDMDTVAGIIMAHKGETPGLGAEIATPKYQAQFVGKKIFKGDEFVSVKLRKGGAQDPEHEVDAISGGTKTSDGVTAMLYNSMEHYLPLLEAKRKAAVEQVVFAPVRDESNEENVENNE